MTEAKPSKNFSNWWVCSKCKKELPTRSLAENCCKEEKGRHSRASKQPYVPNAVGS